MRGMIPAGRETSDRMAGRGLSRPVAPTTTRVPGPGQRVAVRPGLRIRIIRLRVGQDLCQPCRDSPQLDALGRYTIRPDNAHNPPVMICSR
jgi:hypothetical protein